MGSCTQLFPHGCDSREIPLMQFSNCIASQQLHGRVSMSIYRCLQYGKCFILCEESHCLPLSSHLPHHFLFLFFCGLSLHCRQLWPHSQLLESSAGGWHLQPKGSSCLLSYIATASTGGRQVCSFFQLLLQASRDQTTVEAAASKEELAPCGQSALH